MPEFDNALNETFLIMSILSTLLFCVSEILGTFGLKYKSITSYFFSLCGCGRCKRKIEEQETLQREERLRSQVEDEIKLDQLRQVLIPASTRSRSGSIVQEIHLDNDERRPSLISVDSSLHFSNSTDHSESSRNDRRSSGQPIFFKGALGENNSIFYSVRRPQITLEAATPYPNAVGFDLERATPSRSFRSYSDPSNMSTGRVILLSPTALSLYPLMISQSDASGNAEGSDK